MGIFSSLAALTSEAASNTTDLVKGWGDARPKDLRVEHGRGPGKGVVTDPHVWVLAGGQYVEKPNSASYAVLRYLWKRDPLLSAIILTRLRQVRSFAQVRTSEETEKSIGKGFRIRMKEGNAKSRTKAVEKHEDELNDVMINCARPDVKPEERHERDFGTWSWKFCQDRMVYDQATSENVLDKRGRLRQFYALDGSTVRLVDPASNEGAKWRYVQIYEQRVIARFTDAELAFCPENVTSDIHACGYGIAEPELALRMIMTHLGADMTNERIFSPGEKRPTA